MSKSKKKIVKNEIAKLKSKKNIYMMIGNGSKNQFRDMRSVRGKVIQMLKQIPENSRFLYFGDAPNLKKPDKNVKISVN